MIGVFLVGVPAVFSVGLVLPIGLFFVNNFWFWGFFRDVVVFFVVVCGVLFVLFIYVVSCLARVDIVFVFFDFASG